MIGFDNYDLFKHLICTFTYFRTVKLNSLKILKSPLFKLKEALN